MEEQDGDKPSPKKDSPYAVREWNEAEWRAYRRRFTLRFPLFAVAALGIPGVALTLLLDNTRDGWTGLGLGLLTAWGYGVIGSWSWAAKYYY